MKQGWAAVATAIVLGSMISWSGCTSDDPKVSGDEGIYINEVYSGAGDDWIELYNSNSRTANLAGYTIGDEAVGGYVLPTGAQIPANGYLVLVCDGSGIGLATDFKLSGDGETLYFFNKDQTLIDKMEFPALKSGQSYGRFPDGSLLLATSGSPTKGSANGDTQAAPISSVTRLPLVVGLGEEVEITATLGENFGVSSVNLYYRFNSETFTKVVMTKTSALVYTGSVPAKEVTGLMEYYVEALSTNGKTTLAPFDAPQDTYSYLLNTDELPQLVINEIMPFNSNCCPDFSSGGPEYDDWIEIYNPGPVAVDIGGFYVSDDHTNPFNHRIPTTNPSLTTIPAGGYLVIWADNDSEQGPLHTDFGLSSAGEDAGLYYKDGRTINEYTFGASTENTSVGRVTDGATTWKVFTTPTQGTSNN